MSRVGLKIELKKEKRERKKEKEKKGPRILSGTCLGLIHIDSVPKPIVTPTYSMCLPSSVM